ncbi:N(4)-(Beta-N-acetylglucosaminyl)-L-asparaginase [Hermetia illucens]|uniref:N(4)-(Beta-N-acetylglucosaminyl)-L-asparaginase n=1 Tax=Hermetia illucens TaxID=343691 RepID=UPI0018CC13C1|nr:N(4)-(Beta-N-acetylglucosaminyl)-L-asparaginase [Hermetia illucens]
MKFPIVCLLCLLHSSLSSKLPVVINTWAFTNSTSAAWKVLTSNEGNYLDAIVEGCSVCEREQCDGTVGYGGSPDENGETTLDAFIMDGATMNIGAVAGLREIKDAISVAYHVLKYTRHTMLVGEHATEFALMMGFKRENLQTPKSLAIWRDWKDKNCQPNFWTNVLPNPEKSCGPYCPNTENTINEFWKVDDTKNNLFDEHNHDTIGMIAIDAEGNIGAGTSTNGATHKIPGRVGDSPIPGAGAYADNNVGAAAATGDGDIMMRFLPSFMAVERLRNGDSPASAAEYAMGRIIEHYPKFMGAIIVADREGNYSAACFGIDKFPYSVFKTGQESTVVEYVKCMNSSISSDAM